MLSLFFNLHYYPGIWCLIKKCVLSNVQSARDNAEYIKLTFLWYHNLHEKLLCNKTLAKIEVKLFVWEHLFLISKVIKIIWKVLFHHILSFHFIELLLSPQGLEAQTKSVPTQGHFSPLAYCIVIKKTDTFSKVIFTFLIKPSANLFKKLWGALQIK